MNDTRTCGHAFLVTTICQRCRDFWREIRPANLLDMAECWSEDGDVLYCSRRNFKRSEAKAKYIEATSVEWSEVTAKRVWMVAKPNTMYDEWYSECDEEHGDFECWKVWVG